MKENYVDKYKELNFFVVGKPFSGAGLIARMMYGDWKGFKHIDMNYLIDDMYNDFQTINQHHGQMRMAVRSSVILKNAEYLYRSIGIPEFIAAQKMWEWQKLLDENCSQAKFKSFHLFLHKGGNVSVSKAFINLSYLVFIYILIQCSEIPFNLTT